MSASDQLQAIELRRQGASYQQLRAQFGIAKSTLWRWLKAGGVVETQPQRLTELKRLAQQKGAALVKARRIERTQALITSASKEIGPLSRCDLWMLGIALYWAEGSKQRPGYISTRVIFSNSDAAAVRLFIVWLKEICGITDEQMVFEIYLHETADAQSARQYWAHALGLPIAALQRVYWKRHHLSTRRRNTGDGYHGLVRVKVRRSTALNRKIAGWIQGVAKSIGESSKGRTRDFESRYPGSSPGSPAIVAERATTSGATPMKNRVFGRDRWDGGLLQEVERNS